MVHLVLAGLLWTTSPADTTVLLGASRVDLTGDGTPEVLELWGTAHTPDSMSVRFLVRDGDRVVYDRALQPLTPSAFDGGRGTVSDVEYRARVDGFAAVFFDPRKVHSATGFEAWLGGAARHLVPRIPDAILRDAGRTLDAAGAAAAWADIRARDAPVFHFSPGGDGLLAIAWSPAAGRFYNLMECC